MEEFFAELKACDTDAKVEDFGRRKLLHGTPFIFDGKEDDFYKFRQRIASNFSIHYDDIHITGSAKLGFSPLKRRMFDLDSDIDVAMVSSSLFETYLNRISDYQYELRDNRKTVTERELALYHKFLEW